MKKDRVNYDYGVSGPYEKQHGKHYKRYGHRGMNRNTYKILWTAIWLAFIACLCFIFNSAAPLVLLSVWFIGIL